MTAVSWLFGELTPRQLQVLRALNDGRINRGRRPGAIPGRGTRRGLGAVLVGSTWPGGLRPYRQPMAHEPRRACTERTRLAPVPRTTGQQDQLCASARGSDGADDRDGTSTALTLIAAPPNSRSTSPGARSRSHWTPGRSRGHAVEGPIAGSLSSVMDSSVEQLHHSI